jgi:hypothetical protein
VYTTQAVFYSGWTALPDPLKDEGFLTWQRDKSTRAGTLWLRGTSAWKGNLRIVIIGTEKSKVVGVKGHVARRRRVVAVKAEESSYRMEGV